MINYQSVTNIDFDSVRKQQYDIGLFPCGYELRSTYIASKINAENIEKPIVFGFIEHSEEENRKLNEKIYLNLGWDIIPISSRDITKLKEYIKSLDKYFKREKLRILIDYSSFPKLYYMNFLALFDELNAHEIEVTFVYSVAEIEEGDGEPIPALKYEILYRNENLDDLSITFIGTTLDTNRTIDLIEELDAWKTYLFQPNPGSTKEHTELAKDQVDELSIWCEEIIPINILDFENMYSKITEIFLANRNDGRINFVPDGGKPLALAMAMVAKRFQGEIGCILTHRMDPKKPRTSKPTGETIGFTIMFKKE